MKYGKCANNDGDLLARIIKTLCKDKNNCYLFLCYMKILLFYLEI